MLKEFRAFVMRGNVLDLAVAVIIGAAFGKIVTSLVNDVLMPPIGFLVGKVDFSNLYLNLSGTAYASLAEAQKAGAAVVKYGQFINEVINFLIIAFVVFIIVRLANQLQKTGLPEQAAAPTSRECPHCLSVVPAKAIRCAYCTSELKAVSP